MDAAEFCQDKTVLLTGATDGIGKAAARELVRAGAKLILHGRDRRKAEETAHWIRDETGRHVRDILIADLGSLAEVKRLAREVRAKAADLQILINNAGVFSRKEALSPDGFERTFQVNFLAPFLLTLLLENILRKNQPSRVINVTSTLHIGAHLDFDELAPGAPAGGEYDGYDAYSTSKLALSIFTTELAERWSESGVSVFHVHPGGVSTKLLHAGFGPGGISTEEGAQPLLLLATARELPSATGRYYSRLSVANPDPRVFDRKLRDRLWTASAEWVDLYSALRDINRAESSAA